MADIQAAFADRRMPRNDPSELSSTPTTELYVRVSELTHDQRTRYLDSIGHETGTGVRIKRSKERL